MVRESSLKTREYKGRVRKPAEINAAPGDLQPTEAPVTRTQTSGECAPVVGKADWHFKRRREPGQPRVIEDADGNLHLIDCTTVVWCPRFDVADASCAAVGEIIVVYATLLVGRVLQ